MIEKILTFLACVIGLIISFLVTLPFLILRYGVIALALYIVYKIAMYFFGG